MGEGWEHWYLDACSHGSQFYPQTQSSTEIRVSPVHHEYFLSIKKTQTKKPTRQPVSHPVSNQLASQPDNQLARQPTTQLTNQPTNQTTSLMFLCSCPYLHLYPISLHLCPTLVPLLHLPLCAPVPSSLTHVHTHGHSPAHFWHLSHSPMLTKHRGCVPGQAPLPGRSVNFLPDSKFPTPAGRERSYWIAKIIEKTKQHREADTNPSAT